MVIATFNSTTGWAGKTITYDDDVFTLEGHGVITAADVLTYERQGHVSWAYEGLQEWVEQLATPSAGVATGAAHGWAVGGGGGILAYILQSGDPGYVRGETHGLIAAAADQSTGMRWYNGSYIATGARATALGTGSANTNRIIAAQGAPATAYAAGLARAYNGGGYSDWYLPSKDELNQLYLNRDAIGGFYTTPRSYWSSSEYDAHNAWYQAFDDGHQYSLNYYGKNPPFRVRAVRAF